MVVQFRGNAFRNPAGLVGWLGSQKQSIRLRPDHKLAIVRAILSLAQTLGLSTVAEGVETPELARTLAIMGCTWGQGYAFARPLEAEEAYRLIVERNG